MVRFLTAGSEFRVFSLCRKPGFFFLAYINIRLNFFQISLNTITLPFIPSLFRIPMDSTVALCCCTEARLAPRSMPFPAKCWLELPRPDPRLPFRHHWPRCECTKKLQKSISTSRLFATRKTSPFPSCISFPLSQGSLPTSRRDVGVEDGTQTDTEGDFSCCTAPPTAIIHRPPRRAAIETQKNMHSQLSSALWWVTKPPCLQSMALCTNE